MELNFLKGSSTQMMDSIELKFGMYIINHHRTNPIDLGECRMYKFFYKSALKFSNLKKNHISQRKILF